MQAQTPQQQYSQNNQHSIKKLEQEQKWQKVVHKKRTRNSPENTNIRKRQMSINDYWLNKSVETSNTYEKLNVEETPDIR